jgi:hypothetical protein
MSKILSLSPMLSKETTQPILISPQSVSYSLSSLSFDNIYFFKLKITINGKDMFFHTSESKKYSNIIKSSHQIKYEDVNYYQIIVNSLESTFQLDGNINHHLSCFTGQTNKLFIEFSQDNLGYLNCTCYFLESDMNTLCISPPN